MSTLAEVRASLAEQLSTIDGWNVRPRPWRNTARAGDGWITVGRLAPGDFTRSSVVLVAVLVLGADEVKAETRLEDDAVALINAATAWAEPTADVALEPVLLPVGKDSTPVFGATLTLTTEVD